MAAVIGGNSTVPTSRPRRRHRLGSKFVLLTRAHDDVDDPCRRHAGFDRRRSRDAATRTGRAVQAPARARWPSIRRSLPRDLTILLLLGIVAQYVSFAWVMTDSVHTSVALVLKGVFVRPGELAVFAYSGQTIPKYYEDWTAELRHTLGMRVRTLDGPRKGDGSRNTSWVFRETASRSARAAR